MRIRNDILRILNSIVLGFSLIFAMVVALWIMSLGEDGYVIIAVFIGLFVSTYLGLAKLFDKIFKIPE